MTDQAFCANCGTARVPGAAFCGSCGTAFAQAAAPADAVQTGGGWTQPAPAPIAPRQGTSFARIIITPIIVIVAGYLIFNIYGAAIGAAIGIVYVIWASRR